MCVCLSVRVYTPRTRVVDSRADLQSCASQRKMAQQRLRQRQLLWGWGLCCCCLCRRRCCCCAATAAINSKAKNFIRNSKHIRRTDDVQRAENNEQSSDVSSGYSSSSDSDVEIFVAKIQADSSPSTSWQQQQQQKQQRKVTWRLPVLVCVRVCVSVNVIAIVCARSKRTTQIKQQLVRSHPHARTRWRLNMERNCRVAFCCSVIVAPHRRRRLCRRLSLVEKSIQLHETRTRECKRDTKHRVRECKRAARCGKTKKNFLFNPFCVRALAPASVCVLLA